jgi:hypothetical protein
MFGMGVWVADDGASIPIERVGTGRPVLLVHGGFTDSSGLDDVAEACRAMHIVELAARSHLTRYGLA